MHYAQFHTVFDAGLRAGTENTLLVVGMGAACEMARERVSKDGAKMQQLRDSMQSQLLEKLPGACARINGHQSERLPNTLSISIKGVSAPTLLARIQHRVACSAGSACRASE